MSATPLPPNEPSSSPAAVRARKVLIVEDHEDSACMLEALIELFGHEPRWARDGVSALAAATTFTPDVVLLDLTLPDLDGYEVARRLRALPALERVTIMALTGWSDPDGPARAKAAGMQRYLMKPVDAALLEGLLAAP